MKSRYDMMRLIRKGQSKTTEGDPIFVHGVLDG